MCERFGLHSVLFFTLSSLSTRLTYPQTLLLWAFILGTFLILETFLLSYRFFILRKINRMATFHTTQRPLLLILCSFTILLITPTTKRSFSKAVFSYPKMYLQNELIAVFL